MEGLIALFICLGALLAVVIAGFYRLKFRYLEMAFALIVSTLPLGLLLKSYRESSGSEELLKLIAFGLFPIPLFLVGLGWGLGKANLLAVKSSWGRIGYMLVGLGLVIGLLAITPAVMMLFILASHPRGMLSTFLTYAFLSLFAIPGLILQSRCRHLEQSLPVNRSESSQSR
ncbi:MAG TPA: hypothetical protein VEK08_03925 [Planctomycetota bacterium]|nr:hypothetical protein [Planctomycetota bacterium]